jgi:hypothetical protein
LVNRAPEFPSGTAPPLICPLHPRAAPTFFSLAPPLWFTRTRTRCPRPSRNSSTTSGAKVSQNYCTFEDSLFRVFPGKKLRNGLKYSRVTVLPDTLCIHLKRFRHDFAFSSKISSKVTFPLVDLDMGPWLHKDSGEALAKFKVP